MGRLFRRTTQFEMKFSMKGPKRFHEYSETTPSQLGGDQASDRGGKETSAGPRTKRLGTKTVLAFNGTETRSYEPYREVGQVLPGRASQSENLVAWYFDAISIPTGPNAERLKKSSLFVPVALICRRITVSFANCRRSTDFRVTWFPAVSIPCGLIQGKDSACVAGFGFA